jgi:outer membrane immunogenic protein
MKKLLFLFLILFCFINTFAQLKKGNLLINGTLSGSISKQQTSTFSSSSFKTSGFSVQPRVGFFYSDKMVLGVGIGYNYSKTNSSSPSSIYLNRAYTYSISPFVRRYISMGDKVAFFIDGRLNIGFGNTLSTNPFFDPNTGVSGTTTSDSNTFTGGLAIKPGIAFFISEKWSAEATFANFGFDYNKTKYSNSKSYNLNLNYSGLNAFAFGVSYYINR